jgi:hypothetical protein
MEGEMAGAGIGDMHTILRLENLKGRDHMEDLGVDGRITLYLREIGLKGVNWIHLAQDRDQCRDLVNIVMNLRIPRKVRNFLTS